MENLKYNDDGELYDGDIYMGEWDDNHWIPSVALLESTPEYQQVVDKFARENRPE